MPPAATSPHSSNTVTLEGLKMPQHVYELSPMEKLRKTPTPPSAEIFTTASVESAPQ